jgi:pheromone shutdown protein TraB
MLIPIEINLEGLDIALKDLDIKITIKKSNSDLSKLRKYLIETYNLTETSKPRYYGFKRIGFKGYLILLEPIKCKIRVSIKANYSSALDGEFNKRFPTMLSFLIDLKEAISFIDKTFTLEKN